MVDLNIINKYDTDKRIDFENFGEVCKTTFGVGTIVDFEKVSDDPITVKSRVKVRGDWGDSELIPLFYKPKNAYWDDDTLLATDFNAEGGYFEKAWMSFRCDDEVAVMLKEGVPVAVVGFADGVPRPGENIILFHDPPYISKNPQYVYMNCNKIEQYGDINVEQKGPDGFGLKLLKESTSTVQSFMGATIGIPGGFEEDILYVQPFNIVREYLVIVGPLLYIYYIFSSAVTYSSPIPDKPQVAASPIYSINSMHVKGGIYTEDLFNQCLSRTQYAKQNPIILGVGDTGSWCNDYPGMVLQTDFDSLLKTPGSPLNSVMAYGESNASTSIEALKAKFMVRPHTKPELQAAGLWPATS